MPLYDYKCTKCGDIKLNIVHGMNESIKLTCTTCSGDMTKIIGSTGFILKGSGFHNTDYGR